MDTHYTPSAIATSLVEAANDLRPKIIADLAAGNGDLLLAAERAWPTATFIATDIDRRAIRHLARLRPYWTVGRCDLRSQRSRRSSKALKNTNSVCLMLLNPPFSCRGGTRFFVHTPTGPLHVSTAMSFLLLAAEYVADDGHIVSILPLGSLHSQKDAQAWEFLKSKYSIQTLRSCDTGIFPGSAASTALIRFSPHLGSTMTNFSPPIRIPHSPRLPVHVIRGSCPVHRLQKEKASPVLVHYTDIRNGTVELNGRRGFGGHRCVKGPAILIPRVGRITADKIALLENEISVMLSDCVIALKPRYPRHVEPLRDKLISNFAQFRNHYVGTGAPFITLRRLKSLLASLGVEIDDH